MLKHGRVVFNIGGNKYRFVVHVNYTVGAVFVRFVGTHAQPDAIDAILFRMEQQGLSRHDLEAYIGGRSRVSEVLNRKRPLTMSMIRRLHAGLGIPAEVLIKPATRRRSRRQSAA